MTDHAMNNNISLNQSLSIDLPTLLDTRLLVQANSGGGKSWLLRRILEQSHGHVQQIVIDLEGEFATLREKYDYVLAGKDGDTPADPRSAGLLAQRLLELNVSAIIDLYELHYQDRKHFVRLFLESMINAPKQLWHPCLVVIDEAHKFCPEKEQSEASSAVIDLATLGRKRGYCAILATQRLSKLHKDAAAECNNKLIGRTTLDVDMKRASEELGFTTKEQSLSLRNLSSGEFFAFGPAISAEVTKITVGGVTTAHPKAGSRIYTSAPIPPTEKIKKILGALKDLPKEAEEEAITIASLQEQIRRLKAERTRSLSPLSSPADTKLKQEIAALKNRNIKLEIYTNVLRAQLTEIMATIKKLQATEIATPPDAKEIRALTAETPSPAASQSKNSASSNGIAQHELSKGATRLMQVLASHYPLAFTRTQLTTLSRLKDRSEIYSSLSLLRSKELISIVDNHISLTRQGLQTVGITADQVKTGKQAIAMWQETLSGGARRIFDVLVSEYPRPFSRQEIGTLAGLSFHSGTFNRYLTMLRNNGLIQPEGQQLKAAETLFV